MGRPRPRIQALCTTAVVATIAGLAAALASPIAASAHSPHVLSSVRKKEAEFYAPSSLGSISCAIYDGYGGLHEAFCESFSVHGEAKTTLKANGRVHICRSRNLRVDKCGLGNAGERSPTIAYGHAVTIGHFKCTVLHTGIKCTVAPTGKGFLFSAARTVALSGARVGSAQAGPSCVVPSLRGMTLGVAGMELLRHGCKLGNVTGGPLEPAVPGEDTVYFVASQSATPGTKLTWHSIVSVVLARAPEGLESYRVPSGSMLPTFPIGIPLWVQTEHFSPAVGEVIVFHPPNHAIEELCGPTPHTVRPGHAACDSPLTLAGPLRFIKRIVAGPGDTISIRHGQLIRNGIPQHETSTRPCGTAPECNFPTPITIPPGHWFLLGDDRGESLDSRYFGPIPAPWIVGKVVYCIAIGTPCTPSTTRSYAGA